MIAMAVLGKLAPPGLKAAAEVGPSISLATEIEKGRRAGFRPDRELGTPLEACLFNSSGGPEAMLRAHITVKDDTWRATLSSQAWPEIGAHAGFASIIVFCA